MAIDEQTGRAERIRQWLLKLYFVPFLGWALITHTRFLAEHGMDISTFPHFYATALSLMLTLDVSWALVGYLTTFRWLGTHIRSTDPTLLGWLICLICYAPIWTAVEPIFFVYRGERTWTGILSVHPVAYITWGFLILCLMGVYVWSTVSFGARFSNLTNRGIIRHGPYRYLKHPAYVCKNLAWWMTSLPFMASSSLSENIENTIQLGAVSLIYGVRAATEERHLMRDPEYVAYCRWMAEHGLVARVRRRCHHVANSLGLKMGQRSAIGGRSEGLVCDG